MIYAPTGDRTRFALRASRFALRASRFTLHASRFTLRTSHFALRTSRFAFRVSRFAFRASRSELGLIAPRACGARARACIPRRTNLAPAVLGLGSLAPAVLGLGSLAPQSPPTPSWLGLGSLPALGFAPAALGEPLAPSARTPRAFGARQDSPNNEPTIHQKKCQKRRL